MRWFIGGLGAVVVVPLLAGLAGCGAPGGRVAPTATTSMQDVVAVVHELVRCARANGMPNLPDPQIDGNGQVKFPEGTPEPSERVLRACQSVIDRLPPSARGERAQNPVDMPALLRFGQCMRAHGVPDFPDPRPDGTFPVAGTSLERGKTPENVRAGQACRQLNPDPQGRIHGSD